MSLQGQLRPFKSRVVKDDFLVTMDVPSMRCSPDRAGPHSRGNPETRGEEEDRRLMSYAQNGPVSRGSWEAEAGTLRELTRGRSPTPRVPQHVIYAGEQLRKARRRGRHEEGPD